MNTAVKMLTETDPSITEIAMEVSYSNQGNFTTASPNPKVVHLTVAIHPYMWYNKDILRIKSVTWKWSRNIFPFIIKGFAAPSAKICPCVGGNSQQ